MLQTNTRMLELYKEFQEEAYSVALHPTGLFVLVGFSDKLRLMNLLMDDIRTFKEFPIRGCREVSGTRLTRRAQRCCTALHCVQTAVSLSALSATAATCLQPSMGTWFRSTLSCRLRTFST